MVSAEKFRGKDGKVFNQSLRNAKTGTRRVISVVLKTTPNNLTTRLRKTIGNTSYLQQALTKHAPAAFPVTPLKS